MDDIDYNTQLLVNATKNGNATEVARLIPLSDPKKDFSYPLLIASQKGFASCLMLLIPVSDPSSHNYAALSLAVKGNSPECVRLLLPVSDPSAKDYEAFRTAASRKHLECLQLLLPFANEDAKSEALHLMAFQRWAEGVAFLTPLVQKSGLSKALSTAAMRNSRECFDVIFAQIDPTVDINPALRVAALKGHTQYVDVLYSLGKPTEVVADLRVRNAERYEYWGFLEARIEHETIEREIQQVTNATPSVHRKM